MFAPGQLQGEAQTWWESFEYGRPPNAPAITWLEFKENFRSYDILEGLIELKAEEFRSLKQGSMTVREYRDKFAQLSRYAPNEVANDVDKQCLFLKGLYDGLELQLMSNEYPNYQTLVNRAIVVYNKRKEMDAKRKRMQGQASEVILVHAPTSSRVISKGTRDHLQSGIMVSTPSATSFSSARRTSRISSRATSRRHAMVRLATVQ